MKIYLICFLIFLIISNFKLFMDTQEYVIEFLSDEWIRNIAVTTICIFLYLFLGKFVSVKNKLNYAKIISFILIFITLTNHGRLILNGNWNISENLPLQLCSISNLIACTILFIPKNKTLFEFLFYAGIIGAIQAFLTPQINYYDDSLYRYIEYHVTHAGIILLPIYMFQHLNYKLRKYSWLKMLLYLNILVAIIMPLNFQIDSNYMYIAYPPEVNNPLIIGEWPYYILFWEVIVLMFTYSLYVISTRKKV